MAFFAGVPDYTGDVEHQDWATLRISADPDTVACLDRIKEHLNGRKIMGRVSHADAIRYVLIESGWMRTGDHV